MTVNARETCRIPMKSVFLIADTLIERGNRKPINTFKYTWEFRI